MTDAAWGFCGVVLIQLTSIAISVMNRRAAVKHESVVEGGIGTIAHQTNDIMSKMQAAAALSIKVKAATDKEQAEQLAQKNEEISSLKQVK